MKFEIEQRPKSELIFRCNCGGNHMISFAYYIEKDSSGEFWVSILEPYNESFFDRFKKSMRYLFKGSDINYCDVGLTSKDLKKVSKLIIDYCKEIDE